MRTFDGTLIGLGLALHALLLWRCLKERHWNHYPFFFSYLAYTFLLTLVLVALREIGHPAYTLIFWDSMLGAVLLRFCVAWEVYRNIFSPESAVREIAGRALVAVMVIIAAAFYLFSSQPGGFFPDLERKAGLAVVAWLAVLLPVARYYGVPISLNIWGMAVGMGLFTSVSIANFATFDTIPSFLPYWRLVSPFSFLAMMLIWTWTLWSYAPEPQPGRFNKLLLQAALAKWKQSWNHLGLSIRRAIGQ